MSQDVDSIARPECIIETREDAEDEGNQFGSNPILNEEGEQLAMVRTEDPVDMMTLLLTMQEMHKNIELLMKKHG